MKRTAAILTLVAVVSMLGASDVRAGAALAPAGKTTGPGVIATIVIDVTGGQFAQGKGLSTVRLQRAGTSAAVIFNSSYVNSFTDECIHAPLDLKGTTANRFTGLISSFIDTPEVLISLLQPFGNPSKAAITSQDYVACTTVNYGGGVFRQILSFTAVIQFQP
jgi:hypothetical protein